MKIASWNVNSIRVRQERLAAWLAAHQPDVLCLQEIKVVDADFPHDAIAATGYQAVTHGQKTYNGVAILTREPAMDVSRGFGDGGDDSQSRLIAATVRGVRVVCVYVPNGSELTSDKWPFKLEWLRRLRTYVDAHSGADAMLAVCGDYNVAPEPRDVHSPSEWEDTVLFHPDARAALANVTAGGLVDTFRIHHDEEGAYSWWDYRQLGFQKNRGLRIDFVLASQALAKCCTGASIDRNERKGKGASDHAPVVAEFDLLPSTAP